MLIAAAAERPELAAQFVERHALNNDVAGTGQSRQEEALSAEQRSLDAAGELEIVVTVSSKATMHPVSTWITWPADGSNSTKSPPA